MKYTLEDIRTNITTNQKWCEHAIVAIFNKQTLDEQQAEETKKTNGIGFNSCDANILSSFAKQIIKGYTLSEKQLTIGYKKIKKYAKQLYTIAENK